MSEGRCDLPTISHRHPADLPPNSSELIQSFLIYPRSTLPSRQREPLRALLLTWALCQLILLTGTVNLLAPIVSGLFLIAFCLLNLLAFVAAVSRGSFAPQFHCHSRWASLAGFLLAFMAMAW